MHGPQNVKYSQEKIFVYSRYISQRIYKKLKHLANLLKHNG